MRYDAVAFLEALYGLRQDPISQSGNSRLGRELAMLPNPPSGFAPSDLPEEWQYDWKERVAIMMEDGKLPLEHAEAKALADVLRVMDREGESRSE